MAAISFAGRRPPRRRDDRETSRIAPSTVARRGARGRTRTREATRDLRTCSASATPSRASPRLSVPFEARRSWVSWRVSSRRPATTNRRWARGRENVARRWRVGARRRREPPRTETISWTTETISWTPSRASRLSPCPFLPLPPRREWRSRSIASRREASAAGLPRRARRRLANYPILCVRRPPPRPSRGASTALRAPPRGFLLSRLHALEERSPRSSRRRRLSSASRATETSARGRRGSHPRLSQRRGEGSPAAPSPTSAARNRAAASRSVLGASAAGATRSCAVMGPTRERREHPRRRRRRGEHRRRATAEDAREPKPPWSSARAASARRLGASRTARSWSRVYAAFALSDASSSLFFVANARSRRRSASTSRVFSARAPRSA